MKKILNLVMILVLFSCGGVKESKVESSIESTYQTSIIKELQQRENGDPYIKLSVQHSQLLDTLHPNITTANMALLTYIEMTMEERQTIKTIDVEFYKSGQKVESYTYEVPFMKQVYEKSRVFNELSSALLNRQFQLLDQQRDMSAVPNGIASPLAQKLKFLENNYGKLESFETFGIAEVRGQAGKAYQFQAFLNFKKRKIPYFFYLDTQSGNDKWVGFSIKN
jgi:hypothetical protein